jgi:integrase
MRGLGISRATWLRFRRTYAWWAHDVGMPGKVIAQLMGHMKVAPLSTNSSELQSTATGHVTVPHDQGK